MHRETRNSDRSEIHEVRTDYLSPTDGSVLRQVVVVSTKARQVLRREAAFTAEGIASEETVAAVQSLIEADRGLVSQMMFIADVEIVVAVHSRADDCRCSHHSHAATHHSHFQIRSRDVFP